MHPITELVLITARLVFTGDISVEKLTLALCYYGKQTVSAQGSGLLPRRRLHRCVTKQLGSSGDYGGCVSKQQGNRYLLFPHSWFFIHIFTRVGGTAKSLFLDSKMMVGAESLL